MSSYIPNCTVADITFVLGPLLSYRTVLHNRGYFANQSWACLVMANLNPTLTNTLTHISLCREQHSAEGGKLNRPK